MALNKNDRSKKTIQVISQTSKITKSTNN